ncbi:polyamine-transporting ATPase 13A3 isoform X7 [Plutella xylostella]|uniref:polyamine-transporting ATPase 13A3 isoform X7 n=1 Tax=Plutella xylostella TaxID=51655 RepID=UPI0018D0D761|nr:polyamine-transporting ATPase 13A3 isoform X7 [Plutella xylostella]
MPNMYSVTVDNDDYEVIGEAHWQVLETGAEDLIIKIYGYQYSKWRTILFHIFCIALCGLPYFVLASYPTYNTLKFIKCSLKTADVICVTDNEGTFKLEKILEIDLNLSNHRDNKVRYFEYQHNRYIWLKDQGIYANVQSLNEKLTLSLLMENMAGINKRQQNELIKLYGPNSVEVEVKSYWKLFVDEVFNPFYLFQVFSIILWSLDEYYQYATCVFILSAGSCMASLYQTKKMSIRLHDMAGSTVKHTVSVLRPSRGGKEECVVAANRLVPGDVLILPPAGCVMPCDAMLLTGTCIVNESMLTGESVPVMKGPPNASAEVYSTENHKRHTLFAGTHVIQTRFYGNNQVLAKVVRTGFYTAKGELIRSILFPKPFGFQFYKDAVKFVIFLFCIAAIGMAYSIWLYVERGSVWSTILLRTLDIITIVVPPALPAAMTAGTVNSQQRLRKNKIYCLSPPRINVCGKLQVICFDKTGTLTEDGLDLYAVVPHQMEAGEAFGRTVVDVTALPLTCPLIQALASCHSLTSIEGKLTGDPLDLKMFEFTKWVLEEPGPENTRYDNLAPAVVKPASTNESALQDFEDLDNMEIPYEIGLLRRFHFSSSQQSMGVITRVLGQAQMVYFVKGAPEKVAGMCKPETLPGNFNVVLNDYTSNGFRVIGFACKKLDRKMKWVDAQRIKREQLECDMVFLGLLVMQNSLKPETIEVIRDLHDANMRQVMVTGDNIMTAMSVGRVCGMVQPHQKMVLISLAQHQHTDPRPPLCVEVIGESGSPKLPGDAYCLAVEGKTWAVLKHHYPELMPTVLSKGTIFGRFGPDQKTQLITALQATGLIVGMCGDGANDCGALKAAHIGISLSEADASVAAPFTSHEQNIRCVKLLALEGRCALSTSFAIFKYMALYSLIQFVSILILYNHYSILGNNQFLYIDLVLTTLLALSLGRARPGPVLTRTWPPVSLVAPSTTVPLTLQVALLALLQAAPTALLPSRQRFTPEGDPDAEQVLCWENTVVFLVSSFQYLVLACVYGKGQPHRQPFCTNYYMVGVLLSQAAFIVLLLLCPWQWLADFMEVQPLEPRDREMTMFRVYLLLIPALHLVLAIGIEAMFSDMAKFRPLLDFARRSCSEKRAEEPPAPAAWPPALRPGAHIC